MLFLIIFILFAAHCIGDYPFQGEFLAKYKSENNFVLLCHSVIYSAIVAIGFYLSTWAYGIDLSYPKWAGVVWILTASHIVIDWSKCDYRRQLYSIDKRLSEDDRHKKDVLGFYLDQAAHMVVIYSMFYIIVSC